MKLTKKSKKKVAKLPSDPSRLAILSVHYSAKALVGCDAVLARLAEGRTELLDSETFTGPSSLEDARSWLEQHLAARTVVMLAGSDVICRTMTLPPASPDQLEMALRLQVENLLLTLSSVFFLNYNNPALVNPRYHFISHQTVLF